MRRPPLSFLVLGVLTLLAAGAALLGVLQAPTGADVAVHNDIANTLAAKQVDGHYTQSSAAGYRIDFTFVAPDTATEVERGPGGTVKAHGKVTGARAMGVLSPLKGALGTSGFTGNGPSYAATSRYPLAQGSSVTVTDRTTVVVGGGYVVSVADRRSATIQGRHAVISSMYTITHIAS